MPDKTCCRCKKDLPAEAFSRKRDSKGEWTRLDSSCKACHLERKKELYKRDPDKQRKWSQKWREVNRAEYNAYMKQWREAHREHLRAYAKTRRTRTPSDQTAAE